MTIESKNYFNYLVSFSDGAVKTGITSNPFYRLQDYIQEANRHNLKVDGLTLTSPSESKRVALDIETAICGKFSHLSIDGHREWFLDDYSWASEEFRKNRQIFVPSLDFSSIWKSLESEWKDRNSIAHQIKFIRRNPYQKMIDLAAELGASGSRIRAALATEIAQSWLSEAAHA